MYNEQNPGQIRRSKESNEDLHRSIHDRHKPHHVLTPILEMSGFGSSRGGTSKAFAQSNAGQLDIVDVFDCAERS
jgi:hypothetical protein